MQIVITTSESFDRLNTVVEHFMEEANKAGLFYFSQSDLKIDRPQATLVIDRNKAAAMGLSMADIGGTLSSMMGGGYVNYFVLGGRSYKVMPQAEQRYRLNAQQLLTQYVKAPDGQMVQVSSFAHVETKTIPESLPHFPATECGDDIGISQGVAG